MNHDMIISMAAFEVGKSATSYAQWHVEGPQNSNIPSAVPQLWNALPELPLPYPFQVGMTGYVEMTKPVTEHTFGRAQDSLGREVFIVDKFIIFRRYKKSFDLYMRAKTWIIGQQLETFYEPIRPQDWNEILQIAQKLK
jgi:hypothetical protein